MDTPSLLFATILLRPYVFGFLAAFLFCAARLIGWRRTGCFMGITWLVALACELSSTRTGVPFGWYHYTGSTVGRELYVLDVPFMDSLSFPFLLYASYCMALAFLLPFRHEERARKGAGPIALRFPATARTSLPVALLAILFFVYLDVVIDPVALRGERWFLGRIYYYPQPGTHFGVPLANYLGWGVVAALSLGAYLPLDRRLLRDDLSPHRPATGRVLLGCGLYYGILGFNLAVTFRIGESLLGMTGLLIHLPPAVLLLLRLRGYPGDGTAGDKV
ncbi:carotenoid biosynthesis protein [Nitrosovibrio sp. Nv17]|uniref:carotenoid biosynthesis protein n=1 Tax=Nitrosovibrio sp. Nv17 TaxID=1855339 RepID=UPI000908C980|nr:carotenoid biosynthesis protein [Nitrosovibrio sp. Nv17]SFW18321.1 putative membrane protein [Nitrosovibrio sp. Nv17]